MSKYQPYPEYKDSEIEWLGTIPSHWVRTNLKRYCQVTDGSHHSPKIESDGYPFVSVTDVGVNTINFSDAKRISPQNYERLVQEGCKPSVGDLLLTKDGTIGRACVVNDSMPDFVILSSLGLLTPTDKLLNNYLYYYLISGINVDQMNSMIHGSALKRMTISKIDELILLLPSNEEQAQIAAFLDHETAKIDTLIEKQQQLIELLKEKRQAVISHAVTKGLNPDAPMKDSGVEWLGEVPEHWGVVQAKYIADITRGAILRPVDDPRYFSDKGDWAYLNISDATKCDKYLYDSKLKLSPLGSTKSARVYPDNVIITASATIGKAFINKIKVCVHDGFIPFCNSKLDINYLYHYLSNPYLYAAMGKSNTQKNIYLDEVKNMAVTFPPQEEQEAIVLYLESIADKYVQLIKEAETAITLIQERRTALISAAVTGKIDVRNWVTPTTSGDTNEAQQEVIA
ncbi:restriction endonuclease subunit S [Photobacterium damselae subsp. damselae]|uniref:Restriction endonuclease subunit S n=1 Tax=Photobacterium damselae subsp. damselae TaxID=85581 RepID=A0A850QV09_PHODD|nr:restriction endonuclease subunit S [Photobacterium damselae subsp. damselae]